MYVKIKLSVGDHTILANFWVVWGVGVGGVWWVWWPPTLNCCGGHNVRRPFPNTFVLFFYHFEHGCLIHRILNKKRKQTLYIKIVFIYTKIKKYTCTDYWVLFVVLLDLRQGLIVLKSRFFSIIWHVVGSQGGGGENFCWEGGPTGGGVKIFVGGGGSYGGDGTLWACDPRVGWVGNYVIRRGDGVQNPEISA